MTTEEKLNWTRDNWNFLKEKGMLKEAITRIQEQDEFLRSFTVMEIIDIEESCQK